MNFDTHVSDWDELLKELYPEVDCWDVNQTKTSLSPPRTRADLRCLPSVQTTTQTKPIVKLPAHSYCFPRSINTRILLPETYPNAPSTTARSNQLPTKFMMDNSGQTFKQAERPMMPLELFNEQDKKIPLFNQAVAVPKFERSISKDPMVLSNGIQHNVTLLPTPISPSNNNNFLPTQFKPTNSFQTIDKSSNGASSMVPFSPPQLLQPNLTSSFGSNVLSASSNSDLTKSLQRFSTQSETSTLKPGNSNAAPSEFISKIYNFLNSPSTDKNLVRWTDSGDSFVVIDSIEFARSILPIHFKHNNFSSFIRQLNKYGFRKVKSAEKKSQLQPNTFLATEWEFQHDLFKRDRPDLLDQIKRKKSTNSLVSLDIPAPPSASSDVSAHPFSGYPTSSNGDGSYVTLSQIDFRNLIISQQNMMISIHAASRRMEELHKDYSEFKEFVLRQLQGQQVPHTQTYPGIQKSHHQFSSINPSFSPIQKPKNVSGNPVVSTVSSWIRPPHILLVDDDSTCRMLGSKLLELMNCTFEVASTGLEALEKVLRYPSGHYDLILMDIMMPQLDGIEATNQIRRVNRHVPIISMTSNTTETDLSIYLSTGMNDVLAKPFSKKNLSDLLEKYLKHLTVGSTTANPIVPILVKPEGSSNNGSSNSLSSLGSKSDEDLGNLGMGKRSATNEVAVDNKKQKF